MICEKNLGKATAQERKKSSSGWCESLENIVVKVPIQNQALGFYKSDLQLL